MKNKEFAKTIEDTERVIGAICLYSMVFIVAGLVKAICL